MMMVSYLVDMLIRHNDVYKLVTQPIEIRTIAVEAIKIIRQHANDNNFNGLQTLTPYEIVTEMESISKMMQGTRACLSTTRREDLDLLKNILSSTVDDAVIRAINVVTTEDYRQNGHYTAIYHTFITALIHLRPNHFLRYCIYRYVFVLTHNNDNMLLHPHVQLVLNVAIVCGSLTVRDGGSGADVVKPKIYYLVPVVASLCDSMCDDPIAAHNTLRSVLTNI